MSSPTSRLLGLAASAWLLGRALPASAAEPDSSPLVHPIFAHLPDVPENDGAKQAFTTAAAHYNLRPVEVIDVAAPAAPRAPDLARTGILNAQKLAFGEAQRDLDAAAAEVAGSGGAGLTADELSDLYVYRAMTIARADWKAPATPPGGAADDPRTRAFEDYLRAATVAPDRAPNTREWPPQVVADFQRAVDLVKKRARGSLVVKGPADALVSLDGGALAALGGGMTFRDLSFGDHLLRVEQLGYAPWGTVLPFNPTAQATQEVDIPPRPVLGLDEATAAAHARRMGARYALVFQPKGGPGAPVELFLVDSATGVRRDAALVPTVGDGAQIDASVMRLDEEARRSVLDQSPGAAPLPPVVPPSPADTAAMGPAVLLAPAPAKARFGDDPAAWARDHWPLLTAVGVVALSAIVLSAVVGSDRQ